MKRALGLRPRYMTPTKHLSVRLALGLGALILCVFSSREASASPWVLPKERFVLSMTTGFSNAQNEFINDDQGTRQRFPLQGKLNIYSLRFSGRYGIQDKLELEVSAALQSLTYSAESFQRNDQFVNLDTSEFGLGDVYLNLTRQLISGSWPLSVQLSLKLPTGYSGPAPNKLALGSGQADFSSMLQFGHLFKTGTLIGLEGGGVLRLNGPGHQVKYGAKLAQRVSGRLFIFAAQTGYHTVTDGESTGLFNQVSRDPSISANEFQIDEDTYLLPFSLNQNLHQVEVGFFLGTKTRVEYSGALIIPWAGRNASQLISLFLNVSHPF